MTPNNYINRCALGAFLRHWRGFHELSVEEVVKLAGIGHTSWRRMEEGNPAWARTYTRVEKYLELPSGLISRALADDEALIQLAEHVGIDIMHARISPAEFIRSFVKIGREDLFDSAPEVPFDMSIHTEIGKAITNRRIQLNMTQADLARATGVSDMTLRKLEKGTGTAYQMRTLLFVERALGWNEGVIQTALDSGGKIDSNNWVSNEPVVAATHTNHEVENNTANLTQNLVLVNRDLLHRAAIALYRYATDSTVSAPRRDEIKLADEIYEAVRKDTQI